MTSPRPSLIALALLALAACGKTPMPPKPLTAQEKAAFLVEIVEHRPECNAYRDRLSRPDLDGPSVDAIYRDAVKSRCIEKDV